MKKVHLRNEKAFPWYQEDKTYARGILTGPDGTLFSGEDILKYFQGIDSATDLEERVKYANGHFSVIVEYDHTLYVAVDRERIFPLFFVRTEGEWLISDDPYQLAGLSENYTLNDLALIEFLAAGYVSGEETLISNIRQVQAGEFIKFSGDEISRKFYDSYRTHYLYDDEYQQLKEKGFEVLEEVRKNFIAGLEGRPVVLPLSGGFNSRLIAAMLKKSGYKNVTCFSYGRKGNPGVDKSATIARKLGFKWIFVEYSNELIKDFVDDEEFRTYYPYAGKISSMFYMQEYFAVKYLRDKELISPQSIFIPGLFGGFFAGGMLNKNVSLNPDETIRQIAERIYLVKYIYKLPSGGWKDKLIDRIEKNIESKYLKGSDLGFSIHEDWDYKERYAKFVANSTSVYRFFGYEFRLFFTDRKWIEFFRRLPLHAKINKYLYDDMLTNHIFEEAGINFQKELQPIEREIRVRKIKNRIKPFLPENMRHLFLKRKDEMFYNEITRQLRYDLARRGLKIRIRGNSYNSLIIQWYAQKVREFTEKASMQK